MREDALPRVIEPETEGGRRSREAADAGPPPVDRSGAQRDAAAREKARRDAVRREIEQMTVLARRRAEEAKWREALDEPPALMSALGWMEAHGARALSPTARRARLRRFHLEEAEAQAVFESEEAAFERLRRTLAGEEVKETRMTKTVDIEEPSGSEIPPPAVESGRDAPPAAGPEPAARQGRWWIGAATGLVAAVAAGLTAGWASTWCMKPGVRLAYCDVRAAKSLALKEFLNDPDRLVRLRSDWEGCWKEGLAATADEGWVILAPGALLASGRDVEDATARVAEAVVAAARRGEGS